MNIRNLLTVKGEDVVTVTPELTVLRAMRILVEHNIGSVVVAEDEKIKGILTERDILRLAADDPDRLETSLVGDAMTTDLVVAVPDDDLPYVMEVMTRNRVRHLPVIENERLVGILSIGDVVNALRTTAEVENRDLRSYIHGVVR